MIISKDKIKNLVISGGGQYIFSQNGALHYLDKHGYLDNIENYAGTSSGAILSFLLYIGFKPKDIDYFFSIVDSKKLSNNQFSKIFNDYGIDDGSGIKNILIDIINKKYNKNDITFKELFELTNKKLYITASCINDSVITQYFSNDNNGDMSVLQALRMSFSIPLYFTPIIDNNKMYVDGGISNNYPIELFPKEITLGIYSSISISSELPDSFENYVIKLMKAILYSINNKKICDYESNSIIINHLPDIASSDLMPTRINFLKLRKHGYLMAKNKLDSLNIIEDNNILNEIL